MGRLLLLFAITFWEPDEPGLYGDLGEEIHFLRENPININTSTLSELTSIPYINLEIARCIVDGRPYKTKEELLSLPCITPFLYKRISPFIFTGKTRRKRNLLYIAWKDRITTGARFRYKGVYLQWKSMDKDIRWYGEIMGFRIGNFRIDHGLGIVSGASSFFYPLYGGMKFDRGTIPSTSFFSEPMYGVAFSYKGWHAFFLPMDTLWGIKGNIKWLSGFYSSLGRSIFLEFGERGREFFAEIADSGIACGISSPRWKMIAFDVSGKTNFSSFWWQGKGIYGWLGREIRPDFDVFFYAILTYEDTLKETGIMVEMEPWKNTNIGGRIKYKDGLSFRIDAGFSEGLWHIKGRWEQVSGGSMAYISLSLKSPIFIEVRWILYDTEEIVYEYERDIPSSFSIEQLKGEGERFYIFTRYQIGDIRIYLKYDFDSFRMEARWIG